MADHECFPLWEASPGVVGNIDPNELSLTAELREKRSEEAMIFDAILNHDDPAKSDFASSEAEAHFQNMEREVGGKLQLELGPDATAIVKVWPKRRGIDPNTDALPEDFVNHTWHGG